MADRCYHGQITAYKLKKALELGFFSFSMVETKKDDFLFVSISDPQNIYPRRFLKKPSKHVSYIDLSSRQFQFSREYIDC